MNTRFSIASAVVIFASVAGLAAQAPPPGQPAQPLPTPPPMTNLQIFPKDTPRPQVVAAMQNFTRALGVGCNYCHVDDEPNGRPNDMASDEKAPKNKARAMIRLTQEINLKLPTAVDKSVEQTTRVGCVTCHRGVSIPKQLGDILTQTAADKGMPAAVDQYKDLRKRYYGAQAYDFSEAGLVNVATTLAQNKPDEAMQFLNLNLEFYPQSSRTYATMAQLQNRKGDKEGAIKSLEKALELDPQNGQAKRMLDQLKK